MPGMDGIETTLKIRSMGDEDPYYKEVPVVALTANAVLGTKEMFLENGFNDFLSKPIDTVKLNTVLEKWIPETKQKSQE
jgi:CheY-like chemotaxis protein